MLRQRGQPRRGSPWKPRRPSVSPPESPSTCSSQPLQPEPALPASPTLPVSQFDGLTIISRPSCSSSRHLLVPSIFRTIESSHAPAVGSSRTPMGAPPHFRWPRNNENQSSDSFLDTQLRESLTIIFGLVFELRQGVEDLQFRLQTTDGKVAALLHILSSLQEAFPPDPASVDSAAEPHAETSEGNAQTRSSAGNAMEQAKHEDVSVEEATGQQALQDTSPVADRDESNVDVGMQWAGQVTVVEEEPWSEVVHATWPGYLPNV